ncbi:MAG: MFS transporter [Rhodospirillaceae bacterium]|jgi:MFS family permease
MALMTPTGWRNTKIISLIGTGHGMSHFYIMALTPFFFLIKEEFGVSYAAVGFLVTILNLTGTIVQVPVGFLVDKIGGRILLPVGLGMMGVPFLLFGFADNYWFALVLMAIAGIGSSVFHPVDYAILNAQIDERFLGRAFSLHTFTGGLGVMIAPGLMVLLASIWDWRTALVISGGIGIVFMFLMIANGHLLHSKPQTTDDHEKSNTQQPTGLGIGMLFKPQVLLMFMVFLLLTIMMAGFFNFSVTIFNRFNGIELSLATILVTSYVIASNTGLLTGGVIADKWKNHTAIAVVSLLVASALLIFIEAVTLPYILLLLCIITIGFTQGMIRPARDLIVRAIVPQHSIGKVFGFLSAAMSGGHAIAPVFVGWLIDRGHHDIVFYVFAAILMFTIPFLVIAHQMAHKRGPNADIKTAADNKAAAE